MKIVLLSLFFVFSAGYLWAQEYKLQTGDIDRFWLAYDNLKAAASTQDSVEIIQQQYLNQASDAFKKLIRLRNFTAKEYVYIIRKYPKFWHSVRPLTEKINSRKDEVTGVFNKLKMFIPGFKVPDVCFAIGCLRTAGTTGGNMVLVGSEIAASDSTVDKSEMSGWLLSVIGNTGDIVAIVAHESIHCNQGLHSVHSLLTRCINEGAADFFTQLVLNININSVIVPYASKHECELWQEFKSQMKGTDYSAWLYNGGKVNNERPADLGYFMGRKICQAYYEKAPDKKKAIASILQGGDDILEQSGYNGNCP